MFVYLYEVPEEVCLAVRYAYWTAWQCEPAYLFACERVEVHETSVAEQQPVIIHTHARLYFCHYLSCNCVQLLAKSGYLLQLLLDLLFLCGLCLHNLLRFLVTNPNTANLLVLFSHGIQSIL